jgi:citrate lyase subunit beta/citryl-CoA lyase
MLKKARAIQADEIVIDLEDAVLPERKTQARDAAVRVLGEGIFAARALAVRVNSPRSPWMSADLEAIACAHVPPQSVIVPKVRSADDVVLVDRLLDELERAAGQPAHLGVQVLIETPGALSSLREICAASSRLEALILGYADLGASLGRSRSAAMNLELWLPAQEAVLVAARTADLQAIDGPHLVLEDEAGLRAASNRAAGLGFDGKWAIHPRQLSVLTDAFTPSPEDIAHAKAVLAALNDAADGESGAVAFEGEMVDEASRITALRILRRSEQLP